MRGEVLSSIWGSQFTHWFTGNRIFLTLKPVSIWSAKKKLFLDLGKSQSVPSKRAITLFTMDGSSPREPVVLNIRNPLLTPRRNRSGPYPKTRTQ